MRHGGRRSPLRFQPRHGKALAMLVMAGIAYLVYHQALLRTFAGTSFRVMQGQEGLAGVSFLLGGAGAVLSLANVAPRLCVELYEAGYNRVYDTLEPERNLGTLAKRGCFSISSTMTTWRLLATVRVRPSLRGTDICRSLTPFSSREAPKVSLSSW